jgi:hypothetical protein
LQFKLLSLAAQPRPELRLCSVICQEQSAPMHNREGSNNAQLLQATNVPYAVYAREPGLGTTMRYMAGVPSKAQSEEYLDPARFACSSKWTRLRHPNGVAIILVICCPAERRCCRCWPRPCTPRGQPLLLLQDKKSQQIKSRR